MSEAPPRLSPPRAAEHDVHYRAILDQLVRMGRGLANDVHHRITYAPKLPPLGYRPPNVLDLADGFTRIANALCNAVAILQVLRPVAASAAQAASPPEHAAARRRAIEQIEAAIERIRSEPAEPEDDDQDDDDPEDDLEDELDELDDIEDELAALRHAIATRPTAENIARICRDLGLAARQAAAAGAKPWTGRIPTDIETLCAQAAGRPTLRLVRE